MIVISASSCINAEFVGELGLIPPCMLPIGNKKLLELQVDVLQKQFPDEKIILTLPENYVLTLNEKAVIEQLPISVQLIPENLKLSEAILYVLNLDIDKSFSYVRVVQGSVFITDFPEVGDCVGVSHAPQFHNWQERKKHRENPNDWIGYFAFSSRLDLIKSLAICKKSFTRAVYHYQQSIPMPSVSMSRFYDCSHFDDYIHARAHMTTERAFNSLQIKDGLVTKSSDDNHKIQAEIYWFTHIPVSLRRFTPQLIDYRDGGDHAFYSLEFLPFMPLNELYVHGHNSQPFWHYIFTLLQEFFAVAGQADTRRNVDNVYAQAYADDLYRKKTLKRLGQAQDAMILSFQGSVFYEETCLGTVLEIAQDCIDKALALPAHISVMHGDLCFSNIMYDSRGRRIKVFDPRGTDSAGNFSIFGTASYDLAKLAHSVIGMYDFIIAGRYELFKNPNGYVIEFDIDERLRAIREDFLTIEFIKGFDTKQIMPAVVLLFLSMLPLHSDRPDRQQAMLINAFRLYKQYVMEAALCL